MKGRAGQPHGRQFERRPRERQTRYEARARAAGWRLGPIKPDGTRDVMCDDCGKPDTALIRALERTIRR